MQRIEHSFTINDIKGFKKRLLFWAQQFPVAIWLDSNDYKQQHSSFDAVLAVDALSTLESSAQNAFEKLKNYQSDVSDFIFGYLGYDLKNDVEALNSSNFDGLNFPDLFFFQPKKLFFLKGNRVVVK